MKKILFILIVTIASLNAKPCMTDIYFGNGVWNDKEDAIISRDYLKRFMLYKAITRLDPSKNKKDYRFRYIHNPSRGVIDDLIETFWQLYQSGQISYPYFYNQSAMLSVATGNITKNEIWEKINAVVSDYNNDIVTMLHKYQEESFDQKHNVLLVAHSQGNLFGNKMYTLLTNKQKQKFRMVSVATPAYYVKVPEQDSPYVTASEDPVINIIPNALNGNVDGTGHEFVGTYLGNSFEARTQIALYIKNAYDDLMQTASCMVYEAVYMKIYNVDTLEVYAFTTNTFPRYHDLLDTIALETYDATRDSNNELTCGSPTYRLSPNTAFSSCTYETGTSCSWKPGALYKDVLEQRKGTTHHVLHNGKCTTLSLSGELYDLVENALK